MYAIEQQFQCSLVVYEQQESGLHIKRGGEGQASASVGGPVIHLLHQDGNHYDLFRHAPAVDTILGKDISRVVAEAVQTRKRPVERLGAPQPSAKRRVTTKRSEDPSRAMVLNTVASMAGANSGGKTKAVKVMEQQGIKAAAAKRSIQKLEKEGAIYYSQTKRSLSHIGKKWRAVRVDKDKLVAARTSKL